MDLIVLRFANWFVIANVGKSFDVFYSFMKHYFANKVLNRILIGEFYELHN